MRMGERAGGRAGECTCRQADRQTDRRSGGGSGGFDHDVGVSVKCTYWMNECAIRGLAVFTTIQIHRNWDFPY